MRQVPEFDTAPIGVVGNGRVARHFVHYFNLLGLSFRTWSRREPAAGPVEALGSCRTVLVLIRDAEIVPFIESWPALREKQLVHFSGGLVTEAAEGVHPLMTFAYDLYDLPTYRSIPFVMDSGRTPFDRLLPALPNPWFTIPVSERPYYHALCVLAGNFSTILWLKLFDELHSRLGIPASAAHPFLAQITANLRVNANQALTGPLARADFDTIGRNLKALEGDPFYGVYDAFVRAYERRA